jgi:tetratricopeptide (TPR) repeat protein
MKLACLRFRRALAEYAATGRAIPADGKLAKHLAVCNGCSRELDWFRAAHNGLEQSLTAEQASAGFTDAAWARFSAPAQPRRSFSAILALSSTACAVVIALVVFWKPQPPMQVTASIPTAPAVKKTAVNSVTEQIDIMTTFAKPTHRNAPAITRPEKGRSHKPASIRHRRVFIKHRIAHKTRIKSGAQIASASGTHSARTQPFSWVQVASRYEYLGDYRSAAAAYARAARERPVDSLVFNAGRTYECAGNVAQAVEYYTRILKHERDKEPQLKQDSQPKKGTWQWNENWDSA